jgi:polyferredoxin/plastocyanin
VAGCCAAILASPGWCSPTTGVVREITIMARQYGYEPNRIVVDAGDTVRLRLVSKDVVHGFYLDGHDLEAEIRPGALPFRVRRPSREEGFREVEQVEFTAARPGKYHYRCSVTCGTLHPFMLGELVVRPNRPFQLAAAAACAITVAAFALLLAPRRSRSDASPPPGPPRWRVDLLRSLGWLRWLVTRRWFQFAVIVPNLLVLFFFVVAGLFGSPIGNRNIIVTIVWILWWFLLITVLVPFGGRVWCMVCPVPFFGEWFARRRLIGVRPEAEQSRSLRTGSLNRTWPRKLSNLWPQNILFLALCTFSTILVTRPALTAAVLAGMVGAAFVVHAVFRRRSFCRYLCPLNAWMSLYAMTAMTEVRARDSGLCAECRDHSCAAGSTGAWPCAWLENPSKLARNNYCGLCMECVKACPNGNMTVYARPFSADLTIRRSDEAWMAFIMTALVVAYTVTLLGPWGTVKMWANVTEVGNWGGFAVHAALVWTAALAALPALWYLGARLARALAGAGEVPVREILVRTSYLLVPLGLLAWTAFSIPLVMVNYSHITSSLSDPLGWGWDLFGTAEQRWRPLAPQLIAYLQIPLLLVGLGVSLARGATISRELFPRGRAAVLGLLPHGLLCTLLTIVLLRLFVG